VRPTKRKLVITDQLGVCCRVALASSVALSAVNIVKRLLESDSWLYRRSADYLRLLLLFSFTDMRCSTTTRRSRRSFFPTTCWTATDGWPEVLASRDQTWRMRDEMSVATALASAAATNASTTIAFVPPLQGYLTPPLPPPSPPVVPAAATVQVPVRQRRVRRRASFLRAEGRRQARIYSLASRRFLAADRESGTVVLSRHGNSVYGTSCFMFINAWQTDACTDRQNHRRHELNAYFLLRLYRWIQKRKNDVRIAPSSHSVVSVTTYMASFREVANFSARPPECYEGCKL